MHMFCRGFIEIPGYGWLTGFPKLSHVNIKLRGVVYVVCGAVMLLITFFFFAYYAASLE